MKEKNILDVIKQAKKNNLKTLDLANYGLKVLPPEIGSLYHLESLNLYKNQLIELPPEIGNLNNLIVLNLSYNNLTKLPPEIGNLNHLESLNLYMNQLIELTPKIGNLSNLKELRLVSNKLTKLPPEIGNLSNLQILSLSANNLKCLLPEIGNLTNLEVFNLSGNNFKELSVEISNLIKIQRLNLSNNNLTKLPGEIGNLSNLQILSLSDNDLIELPEEIGNLSNLQSLNLNKNQLTKLPPEISKLSNLKEINLNHNKLDIPIEILTQKIKEVLNYIKLRYTETQIKLNEAKMLIVGQGGVGKTSLILRLVENKFEPETTNKTNGINISKWQPDDSEVKINIWDFGGQEIMHSTHQFFLTKRSLYILVWEARQEDKYGLIEYWLRLIQSFGENSPIIIVLNKVDQGNIELDRKGLKKKYENIKEFIDISCQDNIGIDRLKEIIIQQVNKLEHINDKWPLKWFEVKEYLEKLTIDKNFIDYEEYKKLCFEKKIENLGEKSLIKFLHDLGVVLNYENDSRLRDTNILNPRWVTDAVYKLINSKELFDNKGVLDISQLDNILDLSIYPISKHNFIIEMMKKFELCYEINGNKIMIPELLGKEEPDFEWDEINNLRLQYDYNFLPNSIISRFIVRMNNCIELCWKTGVILENKYNRSLIKSDSEKKIIYVFVSGQENTRRDLLSAIRHNFEHIHNTIGKIESIEKIPSPYNSNLTVSYQHLINLEKKGIKTFIFEDSDDEIEIKILLSGVRKNDLESEDKMENRQHIINNFLNKGSIINNLDNQIGDRFMGDKNINHGNLVSQGGNDNQNFGNNQTQNNQKIESNFTKEDAEKLDKLIERLYSDESELKNLSAKVKTPVISGLAEIQKSIESGKPEEQEKAVSTFKKIDAISEEVKKGLATGGGIVGLAANFMKIMGWI